MKKIEFEIEKSNVKYFYPFGENKLLLLEGLNVKNQRLIWYDAEKREEFILSKEGEDWFTEIKSVENHLYLHRQTENRQGTLLINRDNLSQKFISGFLKNYFHEKHQALVTLREKDRKKKFIMKDIDSDEQIWEHDDTSTITFQESNNLYFVNFKRGFKYGLTCLDSETGTQKWSFKLEEHFPSAKYGSDIRKIIGVYEESIYIVKGNDTIIALDKSSGEPIKKWSQICKHGKWDYDGTISNATRCVLISSEIIGLTNQILWKIDLKSSKVVARKILQQSNIEVGSWFCLDHSKKLILFQGSDYEVNTISKKTYSGNMIGGINYETMSLDWKSYPDLQDQELIVWPSVMASASSYLVNTSKGNLYLGRK